MNQPTIQQTVLNLKSNGFEVKYFEDSESAKAAILQEVEPDQTAGFGGSMTVEALGIYDTLKAGGNAVFNHAKPSEGLDRNALLKQAAVADVYFCSTNAITVSGSLMNIDGTGNRLSSLLFGHKKIIIIAGVNKIAGSLDEAWIRIKNVAAPANAKRLNRNTPCAASGKCMNCNSSDRICKATLIIDRQPNAVPITIYLINENLGF